MAARAKTNAALMERDALTPEETALMDDNRKAQYEPQEPAEEVPAEPAPAAADAAAAPVAPDATPDEPQVKTETKKVEEPDDGKKVDLRALHEEREKRKQVQKERDEAKANLAKFEGRFGVLQELVAAQARGTAAETEQLPDPTTDPVGHFTARAARAEQKIAQFEQYQQQQTQQQQQMAAVNQLASAAGAAEQQFRSENPDYEDAANYVKDLRSKQLEALGYSDPGQREQAIRMEALDLAYRAMNAGQNPAAFVYNYAKISGWQGKPASASSTPAAQPVAVATAAPVAPAPVPAAQGGAQKLARVVEGQKANASLSSAAGSAPTETSVESLLKMSDEDFEKATQGKNWKKLMGG